MKIENYEDYSFQYVKAKKPKLLVSSFSLRPKLLLTVLGIGLLCVASLYAGSHLQNRNTFTELEKEIVKMHSMLADSLQENTRIKRSSKEGLAENVESVKRVEKRNAEDDSGIVLTAPFGAGVSYIRWGRRDCPKKETTSVVYHGIAAGNHYTNTGGGANILCLDYNVSYPAGGFINGHQGSSYIYGVEYRMGAMFKELFDLTEIEEGEYNQHAVPCAACFTLGKTTQLMIPGRSTCPAGWSEEYSGYIVGPAHGHKHSGEYLCIDRAPHVVPGSRGDQAGELLYMAETNCPSIQCEPFVNGRELRCVVCSR